MPTYKRVRAGRIAKLVGEQFESYLSARARATKVTCIRIPDGCRHVRGPKGYLLKRVSTPFDYVLLKNTKSIILDAKTVDSNKFNFSNIIHHQLISLLDGSKDALASGYLVWHRPIDRVIFYHVNLMSKLKRRQSMDPSMGYDIGPVLMMDISKLFTHYESSRLDYETVNAEIM